MYEMEQFIQSFILLAILTVVQLSYTANLYLLLLVSGIFMMFFTLRSLSGGQSRYAAPIQLLLSVAYVAISGHAAAYLIFYEFRVDMRLRRQRNFAYSDSVAQCVSAQSRGQGGFAYSDGVAQCVSAQSRGQEGFSYDHGFLQCPPAQPQNQRMFRIFLPSALYFFVSIIKSFRSLAAEIPYILLGVFLLFAAVLLIAFAESLSARYIFAKAETAQIVRMTALAELYEKKLNQELIMKNYLADKNARLEERENISRNIHNSVGHSMTAAIMALDAAELLLTADIEKAGEKVRAANRRIHTGLDSIRQAVRILDGEGNYFPVEDFLSYIHEVAENFMLDTTLQVRVDTVDVLPGLSLPRDYSEFLVGAVSELLTNGVRHGNANIFSVRLAADSAHIRVSVLDNGISDFSPENAWKKIENGYGLKKLISFAERCGGSVAFENTYAFKTVITLPVYP